MDKDTLEVLKLFKKRNSLSMQNVSIIQNTNLSNIIHIMYWLSEQKYICVTNDPLDIKNINITPDTMFSITNAGKVALYKEIKSSKYLAYNEVRAWITLVIAILAFIKSFFY